VFAESAGRELRWFFAQWVERPGAPTFTAAGSPDHVRVRQDAPAYRVRLPVSVRWADGGQRRLHLELTETEGDAPLPPGARLLRVDPDYDVFRRLPREGLPPMLNLFVTDRDRTLVVAGGGTEAERAPYVELAQQILAREPGLRSLGDQDADAARGAVLVLGGPGVNRAAEWAVRGCGKRVRIEPRAFEVEGRRYEGPGAALLVSCRHPERPERVVSLFYGATPEAAAKVARLLFFYGWQSYLVFQDGAVAARGDLPSAGDGLEGQADVP
jgi:hypothetical protein